MSAGHALELVDRAGGRYAAVDRYGSYPVTKAIQEAPNYPSSIVVTTVVLLLLYQGVFTMLTLAFGLIGVREDANLKELAGASEGKRRSNDPAPATTPAKSRAASSH